MKNLDITTFTVEGQQQHPDAFPLAYRPQESAVALSDALSWANSRSQQLLDQVSRHGAVLFRGFPIRNADDFDAFVRAFGLASFTYQESLSNAVRINRTELVFTANEAPADVSIYLHHEMAQTPLFPSRLFFCCEQAAEVAGQTPLCRSDVLLKDLSEQAPAFVEKCKRLGVKYSNLMPADDDVNSGQGRSWRSTLDCQTTAEAELRLTQLGYEFAWLDDGGLKATTPTLPAVRTLVDGREVFFNQLIAAYRGWAKPEESIRYGDNTPFDSAEMDLAIRLADQHTFDLAWESGDVALIDNFAVMHGRRPFQGERRVLVALAADDGSQLAA